MTVPVNSKRFGVLADMRLPCWLGRSVTARHQTPPLAARFVVIGAVPVMRCLISIGSHSVGRLGRPGGETRASVGADAGSVYVADQGRGSQ